MNEEIEQIVESEFKKGSTFKEISQKIGKSENVIIRIKSDLIEKGKLSKEDIQKWKEDRKRIFLQTDPTNIKIREYILAGISQSDTAQLLQIPRFIVVKRLKDFKEFGLISQDEIEIARKQYLQEQKEDSLLRENVLNNLRKGIIKNDIANEIGLTVSRILQIEKSLIEEEKITQEEIDEAVKQFGKITQKKNKVLEYLKQGFNDIDIAKKIKYSTTTIKELKKQFIDSGQLDESEYEEKKKQRNDMKEVTNDSEENIEDRHEKILSMLIIGYDTRIICKKTQLISIDVNIIVKSLIEKGSITKEQIDIARQKYIERTEQKVLIGLKKGYSQREIVKTFSEDEITLTIVQNYIRKLKEKGVITDEEIKKYKLEAEQGEKQRNQFVLEGIKKGLSRKAIVDLDEDGYLTENIVQRTIKKLKEDGIVTDEKIKTWKANRQKELAKEKNKNIKEYDKQIIALLKRGYLEREIAEEFGKTVSPISIRVSLLKNKGKITEEEIRIARQNRKENEEKMIRQEENSYEKCKEKAKRIVNLESKLSKEKIDIFVGEFIDIIKKRQEEGKIEIEELEQLNDLMFMTKTDTKTIIEVVKLHVRLHDYIGGLRFLKSINSILEGEDKEKIKQVIERMETGKRKKEAFEMLSKGDKLEEIHKITGLSMVEILHIKNKYVNRKPDNKKPIENEFFYILN